MDLLNPHLTVSEPALPEARPAIRPPSISHTNCPVLLEVEEPQEEPQRRSNTDLAIQRKRSSAVGRRRASIKINTEDNEVHEIEGRSEEGRISNANVRQRKTRRSTVVDVKTMLGGLGVSTNAKTSDCSVMARRRSTRGGSFLDMSRRYSIANQHKKQGRKVQKCVFEVGKHGVTEVVEKIFEEIEILPTYKAEDLVELVKLIEMLAQDTFKEREVFEEEYIKFHIAQKKMKDFPTKFQDDVDTIALGIRHQNITLTDHLKAQRKHIEDELMSFEHQGYQLERSNSKLIDQKELTDLLVEELVSGLNQRMSLKAQTQIQVNKTMEEIGMVIAKTEGLPEQLEMLAINMGGQIEECKFSIKESLQESERIGIAIVLLGDEIIDLKKESDLLQEQLKEHDRVIKKGNFNQEQRLKRTLKESEAHIRVAGEKRAYHTGKTQERDFALDMKERITHSDDTEIENWENKIAELRIKIAEINEHIVDAKTDRYEWQQREHDITATITDLEGDLKYATNVLDQTKEAITKEGNSVDNMTEEKLFKNEKLKKSVEDAKVARQILDETLEREIQRLTVQKELRSKLVQEWTDCDAAIQKTKNALLAFKLDRNKISVELEQKLQNISDVVDVNVKELERLTEKTKNTIIKLQDDRQLFDDQETDMHEQVANIKRTLESNTQTVLELMDTLNERQPVYEAHQVETEENENLYDAIKIKLVQTQNRESDIKATIKRTNVATQNLEKKFREKKSKKDLTLDQTKMLIQTSSDKVNQLDCKNYELLVEREQYDAENYRIEKFKYGSSYHINSMKKCDRRLSVQLVEYINLQKRLQVELDQYRGVVENLFRQSHKDRSGVLYLIMNFEEDTKRRYDVINHVQQQLSSLAEQFDSYVNIKPEIDRPKNAQRKIQRKQKRNFRINVQVDGMNQGVVDYIKTAIPVKK